MGLCHTKLVPGRVVQTHGVVGSTMGHTVEIVGVLVDEQLQGSCVGHTDDDVVESRIVNRCLKKILWSQSILSFKNHNLT